jgi:hypothetical protein
VYFAYYLYPVSIFYIYTVLKVLMHSAEACIFNLFTMHNTIMMPIAIVTTMAPGTAGDDAQAGHVARLLDSVL